MGLTADACSFPCRDDRQNSGLSILRHLRSRLIIYRNKKIAYQFGFSERRSFRVIEADFPRLINYCYAAIVGCRWFVGCAVSQP